MDVHVFLLILDVVTRILTDREPIKIFRFPILITRSYVQMELLTEDHLLKRSVPQTLLDVLHSEEYEKTNTRVYLCTLCVAV